jgi:hypothetical protein
MGCVYGHLSLGGACEAITHRLTFVAYNNGTFEEVLQDGCAVGQRPKPTGMQRRVAAFLAILLRTFLDGQDVSARDAAGAMNCAPYTERMRKRIWCGGVIYRARRPFQ